MYQCGYCIFKSKRKYNLKIHEERNHINLTNHATPKMSVQQNVNSSNIQNQHNSQYGNEQNTHHNGTTMYVGYNDPPTTINAHSNTVSINCFLSLYTNRAVNATVGIGRVS